MANYNQILLIGAVLLIVLVILMSKKEKFHYSKASVHSNEVVAKPTGLKIDYSELLSEDKEVVKSTKEDLTLDPEDYFAPSTMTDIDNTYVAPVPDNAFLLKKNRHEDFINDLWSIGRGASRDAEESGTHVLGKGLTSRDTVASLLTNTKYEDCLRDL